MTPIVNVTKIITIITYLIGKIMRFVLMIVWALLIILAIYYVTVIAHLFTGMFGRGLSFRKTLIPFYGWTKWFKKLD